MRQLGRWLGKKAEGFSVSELSYPLPFKKTKNHWSLLPPSIYPLWWYVAEGVQGAEKGNSCPPSGFSTAHLTQNTEAVCFGSTARRWSPACQDQCPDPTRQLPAPKQMELTENSLESWLGDNSCPLKWEGCCFYRLALPPLCRLSL